MSRTLSGPLGTAADALDRQIAEEYGQSAAKEALERSSSHLSDSKSGFLAPPSRTNSFADVR